MIISLQMYIVCYNIIITLAIIFDNYIRFNFFMQNKMYLVNRYFDFRIIKD